MLLSNQLTFRMADIFASLGVLPLSRWKAYTQQDFIPVAICIQVILPFQL